MIPTLEGRRVDPGGQFAIVASRFNDRITTQLVQGALGALRSHGIDPEQRAHLYWVPGAFELPLLCQKAAASGRYVAVIALGAVIRGATPHFDYVCAQAASGVAQVSQQTGVPCLFGVLTTDTLEQAIERSGVKVGNKGAEAAVAAIEMASLLAQMES